jgi:predicted Zn-dependent protease with MMP-like domain
MDLVEFEKVAQEAYDSLPERFRSTIENVRIVIEDQPDEEARVATTTPAKGLLLGLYQGVPRVKRGSAYGAYPVVPDKITLYRKNIEAVADSDAMLRSTIREVLIHEIAHYFGMTEKEIRDAGY